LDIPEPGIVVGVNENYYGMYVPSLKTIFLTSLTNEFNAEWIISHETLHHVLEHRISHDASVKLDDVDFEIWVLLHHDSGSLPKNENVLRRILKVTASFFAKVPAALLSK